MNPILEDDLQAQLAQLAEETPLTDPSSQAWNLTQAPRCKDWNPAAAPG